jgi:RNA polymerase sigma-70 factor (ECF subfamily)
MSEVPAWRPERYRALLLVVVRQMELDPRLRRRFDASDVVQDALLKALKGLPNCRARTEAEFVAWLHEILETVAIDEVRRGRAQKRDVALEQSIHAVVAGSSAYWEKVLVGRQVPPDEDAARRELMLRLAEAIKELPDDQRDVVICRDVSGMAVAEIADRLGRSEKSVACLLLRGRRRLRELLADYQP